MSKPPMSSPHIFSMETWRRQTNSISPWRWRNWEALETSIDFVFIETFNGQYFLEFQWSTDPKRLFQYLFRFLIWIFISWIFTQQEIDINAQNRQGHAPLHEACRCNNEEIIKLLLECKGINIAIMNNRGITAINMTNDVNIRNLFN